MAVDVGPGPYPIDYYVRNWFCAFIEDDKSYAQDIGSINQID